MPLRSTPASDRNSRPADERREVRSACPTPSPSCDAARMTPVGEDRGLSIPLPWARAARALAGAFLAASIAGCDRVEGGKAAAVWDVAPDQGLDADTTTFTALVHRVGCNNGVTDDVNNPTSTKATIGWSSPSPSAQASHRVQPARATTRCPIRWNSRSRSAAENSSTANVHRSKRTPTRIASPTGSGTTPKAGRTKRQAQPARRSRVLGYPRSCR